MPKAYQTASRERSAPPREEPEHFDLEYFDKERPTGQAPQQAQAELPGQTLKPTSFDPHATWQMLLGELALQMPSATYNTWVRDTWVMAYEDGEFIIGLPNAYARDWLENRLRHKIKRALSSIMQRGVQVNFRVQPRLVDESVMGEPTPLERFMVEEQRSSATGSAPVRPTLHPAVQPIAHPPATKTASAVARIEDGKFADKEPVNNKVEGFSQEEREHYRGHTAGYAAVRSLQGSQRNGSFTFDNFVVGNHNKLAHAAAEAVAEKPGHSFNPLFLYGGVGLGKTHLLHAISHRAEERALTTLYCSSEQFTNELIAAIRGQSTDLFRNKYRQVDILLIDDIQFIAGKDSTQEEFFHTFNHLHASGKQVVLSSDRPPKALATLEERLRSRFEGGLQTDISQPDFETRVAILQAKAARQELRIEPGVLMLVAERVDSNIRELEGALNRLTMQARLLNITLTVALATHILNNLAPTRAPCLPDLVVRLVAAHFALQPADLTGRKRTAEIANARQIAMFLLREENELSLPAIGEQLGGRDHSTIKYGVDKIAADLEGDENLRRTIAALREKIYTPFIGA